MTSTDTQEIQMAIDLEHDTCSRCGQPIYRTRGFGFWQSTNPFGHADHAHSPVGDADLTPLGLIG